MTSEARAIVGRWAYRLNLPITITGIFWATFGRGHFVDTGWLLIVMVAYLTGPVLVLLLVQLTLTTLPRPRRFDGGEIAALGALALGWFGVGFFVIEVDPKVSVLTELGGASDRALAFSAAAAWLSATVTLIAWTALLGRMTRSVVVTRRQQRAGQ